MHTLLGKILKERYKMKMGLPNKIILDNDVNEMRTHLRKAILQDKKNYSRVLIDPMYKNVKPDVLGLLREILRETQLKTEKELSSLENNFKQYKNIPYNLKLPESTVKMIQKTIFELIEIKMKMKNNSYFDYLDSLEMITIINNRLIKAREELINFRRSSEHNLTNLENHLHDSNLHIKETYTQLKTLESVRLINIVIAITSLFFVYISLTTNDNQTGIIATIFISIGLGMTFCKFTDSSMEHIIKTGYIDYIFMGTTFFIGFWLLIFVIYIIIEIYNWIANSNVNMDPIIYNIILVTAIPLIATFLPYTSIKKKKLVINDETRVINDIETTINENKLVVSTLNSF